MVPLVATGKIPLLGAMRGAERRAAAGEIRVVESAE